MQYNQMLNEIEELVKNQADIFTKQLTGGMDAWAGHVEIVRKYALIFAKDRHADLEVVELSAILHDYARYLDCEKYGKIHAEKGAELAHEILSRYNYDKTKTEKVCDCISKHDRDDQAQVNSLEGICLADADGYVHIVNCFEIYNAFRLMKKPKTTKESLEILLKKVEKSFGKMSNYGKKYAQNDFDLLTNYIKKAIGNYIY